MEITETTVPKGRWKKNLWGIFMVYLIVVVIVQIMFIWRLHGQIVKLNDELEETHTNCNSFHSITKRYIHHCPPGCIRRRRRKGLFGAAGRQESSIQPYLSPNRSNLYGNTGQQGEPGYPGERGGAGAPGQPGQRGGAGAPGQPGERGGAGAPGLPGQPGQRGGAGAPGLPGQPGERGGAGAPGQPGQRGGVGAPGLPGQRGGAGLPGQTGERGGAGGPGYPGERGGAGSPGLPGSSGSAGASGPSGERSYGYSYEYGHNYNPGPDLSSTGKDGYFPVVRSGHTRGDQGMPRFDPNFPLLPIPKKNETQMADVVKELRLLDHPECKDDLDHQALLDTFKEKGKVSFMILVDLQDSVYCIVHSKTES